jgi:RNA polymerase sigma-70 factor, ECF subfamily
VNTCLTLRQRGLRRRYHEVGSGRLYLSEPCGKDADPEAAALSAERQEEIRRALRNVREEHRDALVLRHAEGLSYAEIAEIFQVPEGTAKGWVSRGRAAMFVALS